jgi:hypothetical protein
MNLIKPGPQKMSVHLQGDPAGGKLDIQENVVPLQAAAICLQGALFFTQQQAELEAKIIRPAPHNGDTAAAQETEAAARIRKAFEEAAEHNNKTFQALQTLWNDVGILLRKPE